MAKEIWELEEREPTERELLFAETHKRWKEQVESINKMMLEIVRAQVTVEGFMIELLEAHGRDPQHFFFTSQKITELKKTDTPEAGQEMWELLSLCSYVRNELVHSLNTEKIKEKSEKVREAYLVLMPTEREKKAIREMDDTQMVTSALQYCGSFIVIGTMRVAEKKKGN